MAVPARQKLPGTPGRNRNLAKKPQKTGKARANEVKSEARYG